MKILISKKYLGISLVFSALFIFLLYSLFLNKGAQVLSVFPLPNDQAVGISVVPYVVFSSPQTEVQQKTISVSSSPQAPMSLYWNTDGKILYISPDKTLEPDTKYVFVVGFSGKSYSWSFKTLGPVSDAIKQGAADYRYSQALNNFYNSHPWYNKIPPRNDNYFIGFDANRNEFFADLYPKRSSSLTIDEQTNQLKNQAIESLKSIGVDLSLYKIVWSVYPK